MFQRSTDLCDPLPCCSVHCCTLSWVSAKLLLEWSTNRGGFSHHGRQDPSFYFARGIPTGYTRVLSVALPYSGHCSLFTTTFSTSSYPYCRLVYCTTDTTVSSYTVRTPPTAFLLSLSPFLMAATLYLLLVLSAGALYHRYYCTFFHREHSAHGISTVTVSTFSDGWSTSTQSLFHHPSIR